MAKIVNGKNIRGVLHYNENKVANAEAELLTAAGFPRGAQDLSFKNKMDWFDHFTRQNEHTKTNAMHIMLNFSRQDAVDNELMKTIAAEYMERIGFGQQPYLLYRHYDAAHPHMHIATVNIADGGQRIETHNLGRIQSEQARKAIEIKYGLLKAEEQRTEALQLPRAVSLDKVQYGKRETKAAISAVVREVVDSYKYASLAELNAILQQFNIRAYRGEEGSVMHAKGGLVYQVLDSDGKPIGIPIKASSIFGNPILRNLEKRYAPNETSRKPYGQRLKHLLDKAISTSRSLQEFKDNLHAQGIRILMRENVQGNVYGVTFIDNATRVVFNGSDLGKAYSAKAFMERLEARFDTASGHQEFMATRTPSNSADATTNNTEAGKYPASDQPTLVWLPDALLEVNDPDINTDPFKKKKKRRQQIE